jgi:hypothetical protein
LLVTLIRDKQTGKTKAFALLRYADQGTTILAIDIYTEHIEYNTI